MHAGYNKTVRVGRSEQKARPVVEGDGRNSELNCYSFALNSDQHFALFTLLWFAVAPCIILDPPYVVESTSKLAAPSTGTHQYSAR